MKRNSQAGEGGVKWQGAVHRLSQLFLQHVLYIFLQKRRTVSYCHCERLLCPAHQEAARGAGACG